MNSRAEILGDEWARGLLISGNLNIVWCLFSVAQDSFVDLSLSGEHDRQNLFINILGRLLAISRYMRFVKIEYL